MSPCRYCCDWKGWGDKEPHAEGECLSDRDRKHLEYSKRMLELAIDAAKAAKKNWPTCPYCGERYGERHKYRGMTTNCGRPACRAQEAAS